MATRSKASKKAPGDNKDADPARPSRLRVMRRDVEEVLRSPRRGRPKLQQHKEGGGDEAEDDGGGAPARYDCAFQHEGGFAPPEMVWCKVRSHPWWPAQVFDAADASELALQHAKAGAPLVAYFWDKTFAWSDTSALLPFRANFARLSGQSTIFNFVSSVDAALQEVGRRIEVGLSCGCFADTIAKKQEIQNTGIREGAYGAMLDDAYTRDMFRGKPFLDYISALGKNPLAGADRLDLATAKAQLRSFNRWRGARELPEFVFFEGIENVAEAVPHTKRKRTEKRGADDVSSKENKSKRGGGSSHKGEALPEPAKEEGSRVTRKSSAKKKTEISKDADKSEAPAKKEGMVEDNSMSSSKERKSRHMKGSAKNKKDTSRDADKRESLPEPGNEEATNEDNSMPSKVATGDTLSKERKSRISKSSSKKKKKETSKDADKRESVPEPAKEDATGEDSSTPGGGATDGTLSKKMKSKSSKSSAKKKKDTSRDADSLETVGGSNLPDEKAVDGVLNESKSGRRLRSAQKIEEALEGLKGLNEDGSGETMKGENNDAALLKESNLGRRARSARQKDKITEDGDGLADGSAKDSVSPGKKRSGRGESSVANNAPISISEHGRKKKKLSELMVETDTPNPSTGGKGKARVKRSLPASTEKPEDPDRDTADTMKTRKRKKLDTLGDLSSQSQSLSRKKSTKAGELTGKPAREKSQTSPVVEANDEASQTRSRRAKNREITVSDKSMHSVKLNKGKKDASLEDSLSCGEMLSQLCLAARNVKKISKISPAIVSFFTDFRKSLCASNSDVEMIAEKATDSENHASSPHADEEIPETENATITEPNPSEPVLADHMKDDYWADILINVEEPLSGLRKNKDKGKSQTSKKEHDGEEVAKELPVSVENVEEPSVESKKDNMENGKAETKASVVNGDDLNAEEAENPSLAGLVMNFGRASAVPSRSDLIKIFSQYGPVNEAKIDIADNANCAQVIFKRRMDAEAAFGAAGKMTALGPALVSFRLTDFPCTSASGNGPQQGA